MTAVFPARPRTLLRVFGLLLIALVLGSCGPDPGLRVEEPDEATAVPSSHSTEDAGPANKPFDAARIRQLIIDADELSNQNEYADIHEVLLVCTDCVTLDAPLLADGQKFQLATISTPRERRAFAGVVVTAVDGQPKIELIVTGHDLTLTPGREGTVVVQESLFREGDPECCPSGWSVRVFRFHKGRFEQGQRISKGN